MTTITATVVAITTYMQVQMPGTASDSSTPQPIAQVVLQCPSARVGWNQQQSNGQIAIPVYTAAELATYIPGASVTLTATLETQ